MIRNIEIPSKFVNDLDIENEGFADDINRVFPIDNLQNIQNSLTLALNDELSFYTPEEKLIIIERLSKAAKSYDLEIDQYIDNGGTMLDKNSQEFKDALAEAVNEELKKLDNDSNLKELDTKVSDLEKKLAESVASIETLTKEKTDLQKSFDDYKSGIERDKLAEARMKDLQTKGFTFEKNADSIRQKVMDMDESSYANFIDILSESRELGKKSEKKEGHKEDPVKGSDQAIANTVEDGQKKEEFPGFDNLLKSL